MIKSLKNKKIKNQPFRPTEYICIYIFSYCAGMILRLDKFIIYNPAESVSTAVANHLRQPFVKSSEI